MSLLTTISIIILVILVVVQAFWKRGFTRISGSKPKSIYSYSRKDTIMTDGEISFYRRLEAIAGDRYYIFPQIHIDLLVDHQRKGQNWQGALNAIQRKSVDYVLCDKQTMKTVYAVELDDSTHDSVKRIARDAGVEDMFASIGLPLVRFRDVTDITDDQIAQKFQEANAI